MLRHTLAALALAGVCAGAAAALTPLGVADKLLQGGYDSPDFAPDGKRIVLLRIIDGVEQLAVADAGGGHLKVLTHDAFNHEDPAWSPDGRRIVYVSMQGGGAVLHLASISKAGVMSGDVAITPADRRVIHPSWSPDGKSILYCTDDDLAPPHKNDSEIYAYDVASKATRAVISGGTNTFPVMSPDGRRIAFRRMVGETEPKNSEVWIANADGTAQSNLTNHAAFDGWPSWSPDGRRIAFGSNRDGNYRIYVMNADGSNVQLAADTPMRATAPKWTRDGRSICFPVCSRETGCDIWRVKVGR